MRILLARHAPSLGQKDSKYYAQLGDINVPLDPEFEHLSVQCGQFLKNYYQDTKKPPLIWTSQFVRAQQTYAGIKQGLGDCFDPDKVRLHIEPLLNEQSFGLLPHLNQIKNPIKRGFAKMFNDLAISLYKTDKFTNKPLMGQAPAETFNNVRSFIAGSFQNDALEGEEDFLIISHGAVMKSFVMHWFHEYDRNIWADLSAPNNCDVYEINGQPKNWTLKKIYDGPSATDLRDNPIFILDKLPNRTPDWQNLPPLSNNYE